MFGMLIEIFIAILIGILLGTFTGLTPGIHINLVAATTLALSPKLLEYFPAIYISTVLISMAITHTFLDVLPTTFLGVADADNALTLLPSQRLLLEGRATESIKLALIGSFLGLVTIIIATPFLLNTISSTYELIKDYIPHILVGITILIIKKSKDIKVAITIFMLSGTLGIVTFSLKTLNQPLLPLLSGLFGISSLILGIKNKLVIPEQLKNIKVKVKNLKLFKNLFSSGLASLLTSFLPGLTSSHTTTVASAITEIEDEKDYIIINNSISTISMFLSIIALYAIEKARNGVIVSLSNILPSIGKIHLVYFSAVSLITAAIAIILTLKLEKIFSSFMPKINYKILALSIVSFILLLTLFISGPLGLLVIFTSTVVGIAALLTNIERIHMMGTLILPIIFYFTL